MRGPALIIGEFAGARPRGMARRRRRRVARRVIVLRSAVAAVVLGAIGTGVWWLLTAPLFRVARVESGPYRYTDETQLQNALSGCLHRNVWRLSTGDVAAQLRALPWVRDLHVRKRLPDAIVVDFREWNPVLALPPVSDGGSQRLLLENGRVLPLPAHLDPPGLPLLVGARVGPAVGGGTCLTEPDGATVLALLRAIDESGLESATPVDFVLCRDGDFVLMLQDGRGSLDVGHTDFAARLARYLTAGDQVPRGSEIDLRFRDRITYVPPAETADAR